MTRRDRAKKNRRPGLERLEQRDVPATWGIAWPDAQHLTLSFVPDGTSVMGQSSQLFGTLDSQLGAGKWEQTILDAFQTWAENSNINIGQVADGGQALGVAGLAQGDARFGDIRVAAAPLPAGVAAITTPYDPGTGTYSGDMILNSNDDFSSASGYDLFTVALHEAGHSFGFADSDDPSSFMYDVYQGPQAGLRPGAAAALQALYGGPRSIDGLDGTAASSDPTHPTDVSSLLNNPSTAAPVVGDLSTIGDANFYQVKVPAATSAPLGVDIQVQTAGLSQLAPQVIVVNASGQVVGAASSTVGVGGVSVHIAPSLTAQTYKFVVNGPTGDLHSIGSYTLGVTPTSGLDATSSPTAAKATSLPANGVTSVISSAREVDAYTFKTPATVPYGATVQFQGLGIGMVTPQVSVYTAQGILVGQATASDPTNPTISIRLAAALPNTTYTIKVVTGILNAYQFGSYQLSTSYAAPASNAATAAVMGFSWLGGANVTTSTSTLNTSVATAAKLVTPAGYVQGSYYAAMAGISNGMGARYYDVKAPDPKRASYLTVSVQALGSNGFAPWVTVVDKNGVAVASRVLSQSGGVSVLQVPLTGASDYFVRVAASGTAASSTGNFYLNATFGNVASSLGTINVGMLGSGTVSATTSVTAPSTQVYEFALAGVAMTSGTDAMLRMAVTDSTGAVMATVTCLASEATTMNVVLGAGTYTVTVSAFSPSGASLPTVAYLLAGTNLTDPIMVYKPAGSGTSTTTR